jgi:hypothetical protein
MDFSFFLLMIEFVSLNQYFKNGPDFEILNTKYYELFNIYKEDITSEDKSSKLNILFFLIKNYCNVIILLETYLEK